MFGDDCEVLTVIDAGRHGRCRSVLSFYFRDEVLPYYAGDAVAARDLAANDFKYWELMRRACERGLRVFDYGRSKRGTGSFDFKKNWGFEPQPLHYEYRLLQARRDPAEQSAQSEVPGVDRAVAAAAASARECARADADPQPGIAMGDVAQWVRGLVGRRADATGASRRSVRVDARAAPPEAAVGASLDRAVETPGWRATWRLAPIARGRRRRARHSRAVLADRRVDRCDLDPLRNVHPRLCRRADLSLARLAAAGNDRRDACAPVVAGAYRSYRLPARCGSSRRRATSLSARQFALAFMLQAAIVTVLGTRVARAAFFPLAFLLFAVPFGEIFVPTLIDWTADFTVSALRWSGVPVYREANLFLIPSGAWSVVEACSGIRYLIASVMIGTIYAAVAYRSTRRRAIFMLAAILVPIVANWLRAYMIVMIGHLSNNRLAVGVDHLIYGWIFFGLVMLLLFWIGSFWQEDAAPELPASRLSGADASGAVPRALFAAAFAAIVAAGVWVPIEASIDRPAAAAELALPAVAGANGWASVASSAADWKPHYEGYAAESRQAFNKEGRDVGLYIAYYPHQARGRELVTSGNQLVVPEDLKWKPLGRGQRQRRMGRTPPGRRTGGSVRADDDATDLPTVLDRRLRDLEPVQCQGAPSLVEADRTRRRRRTDRHLRGQARAR